MSDFSTLLAIKDLMTADIVTIPTEASATDVAKLMTDMGISSVVVTNGEGLIAGIVTETDVVRKVVAVSQNPDTTKIHELMSPQVYMISGKMSIFEARHKMAELKVKHLVVEEDGKPIGLVSATALLGS